MDKEQARNFIHRYIEGRFTAAEHQAFHEWLLKRPFAETEELLHEYSRVLEQKRERIPADPRLLERIERYISQQSDVQQARPIGRRVKRKIFYAAAAAVALFITLSGLYRLAGNETRETPVVHSAREVGENIAPGGDKALLTLADGSQILLDDASRGALTRQGHTQVLKLDHGELAYRPGNGTGEDGSSETFYNTIETPRGGQYQLTLSDGTKVWLNAASSLRFPASFNGPERTVFLTGEAYFEVASSVSPGTGRRQPFYVRVNDMEVSVLGTHFNIMAYEDESQVRTTLLEGSVEVRAGEQTRKPARLSPGQCASLDKASATLQVKEADVEEAVAWQRGYFQFNRADIYTIMRQVSRWYDLDVVYEGTLPKEEFVGKISRSEPLSKVLRIFELSRIHFRIEDKTIIVMP